MLIGGRNNLHFVDCPKNSDATLAKCINHPKGTEYLYKIIRIDENHLLCGFSTGACAVFDL